MANLMIVAKTAEISPGGAKVVEANGREIAIFNLDGSFHAIDNACVHKGGPLGEGMIEGEVVVCPWHNWRYNVKTGACLANPSAKVKSYELKVENGEIKLAV
jgi:nitrite reductase (NADH) small subunit